LLPFSVRSIAFRARLVPYGGTQARAARCNPCVPRRGRTLGRNTEIIMKPIKSLLACLAATGIVLSQPAAAAGAVRSGSPAHDSEQFAGVPGAAIPAIIGILAVAVVAIIASSNDDDNAPASP
jgi:hypothetical protein